MAKEPAFDQAKYWVERHEKLRDDPRSVGNLAATLEQNSAGERELKEILSFVARSVGGATVLDIGCGYGRAAGPFIENHFLYTGVDISPVAIEKAQEQYPMGQFTLADLREWKPARTYDLVCVLYVFVHFVDEDAWRRMLEAALSAVKPGGKLIIADHFSAEREHKVAHVVSRPLTDYTPVLSKYGLAWDDSWAQQLVSKFPKSSQAKQFRLAVSGR